jgi:hypothetical protein
VDHGFRVALKPKDDVAKEVVRRVHDVVEEVVRRAEDHESDSDYDRPQVIVRKNASFCLLLEWNIPGQDGTPASEVWLCPDNT